MKDTARQQLRIHSVNQIKSELVNLTLIVMSFGAIPTLWSSLIRIPSIGFQPVMALHILMTLLVLATTFLRHKIGLVQRSGMIIVVMFLVGIGGLINFGLSSNGIIFLLASSLFATIYFSVRIGIAVLSISLLSIVAVALMLNAGVVQFNVDFNIYNDLFSTWLTFIFSLLFLGIIFLISLGRFNQYFDEMVENLEEQVDMSTQESKRANAAKSQFMANMSHEIRTPMNGVLGMLRLLANTELNEAQRHKANLAQSSAESLLELINDILDFSKIEAGKMTLEQTEFSLHRLFGEIAEANALSLQSRGVELLLELSELRPSLVVGDSGKLRQILNNLVSNAVKFTPQGEISISAHIEDIDQQRFWLICEVRDTGIGIAVDKLPHLFDAFTQADASTTRIYGGTGLGLCISRKLCELLGGTIEVESFLEKGSCFRFQIVLERSEKAVPVDANVDISQLRLLVVDDYQANAEIVARQLSLWGANTDYTDSAKDALSRLEESSANPAAKFDGAIVDMDMPEMSGMGLVEAIEALPDLNDLKIVLMTSLAAVIDAEIIEHPAIVGYFPKPATTFDLQKTCHCLLGKALIRAAGEEQYKPLLEHESPDGLNPKQLAEVQHVAPHVLIVEDNLVNQQVILGILGEFHCTADIAENGQQALTMLELGAKDTAYELVLMDCQMPLMDGYEASKRIRSGEAGSLNSSIAIVAMTANAMEGDEERCLQSGMNDYISKPIDPKRLLEKLYLWLCPSAELKTNGFMSVSEIPKDSHLTVKLNKESLSDDIVSKNEAIVWDQSAAFKRLMRNHQLLQRMVSVFLRDIDGNIKQIGEHIIARNWEKIRYFSHALKGSSANIGGVAMSQIAAEIEVLAKQQKTEKLDQKLREIMDAKKALVAQLQTYLDTQ